MYKLSQTKRITKLNVIYILDHIYCVYYSQNTLLRLIH